MALKCTGTKKKACFCTAYNGIAADGNACKSCKHPFANHTLSTAKAKHDSADNSGDDPVWDEDDASDNNDDEDDDEDTHRRPVAQPKSVRGILSTHSIKLKPVDLDAASFLAGQKETSAGLQSGKMSKKSGLGLIDTLDSAADKTMKELGKTTARKSGFKIATIYMLPEGLEESAVGLPRGNKGEDLVRHGLVVTDKNLQRDMDFDESSAWIERLFPEAYAFLSRAADDDDTHTPGESLFRVVQCKPGGGNVRHEVITNTLVDGTLMHKYLVNKKNRSESKLVLVSKYRIPPTTWMKWRVNSSQPIEILSDDEDKKVAAAVKPKVTTRITRSATQSKNTVKRRFVSESSEDDKPKKRSKVRSPSPVAGPSRTASRSARSPSPMLRTSKVVPTRAQTPPRPFSGIPPPPAVGTFSSP